MPTLAAIATVDFPFKANQQEIKKLAKSLFSPSFPEIERILSAFDNSEIETRNLCKPLDYYTKSHTFQEQNLEYVQLSLEYSVQAIEACLSSAWVVEEEFPVMPRRVHWLRPTIRL
jgi:alkylresorcinol/alkylpyrone synthase